MRDDRERGLFSAVVAVAAGLELSSTLRRIVQAAADLVDAKFGALGVLDADGNLIDFVHVGLDQASVDAVGAAPSGLGVLGLLIDHPVPIRLDDLSKHPASVGVPKNHPPMGSFLGVPVRVRGEVFGNLYLTNKRGGVGFTAEDERTVMALAAAAAVAIENSRLYERSLQRERWQSAVYEIVQAVLGGAEVSDVLTMVTEQARRLTGADLGVLALPDADGRLTIEIADLGPEEVEVETARPLRRQPINARRQQRSAAFDGLPNAWLGMVLVPESLVYKAYNTRSTIRQSPLDTATDGRHFGSMLALPLVSGERVLGVLILLWDVEAGSARRDVVSLAESFAAQAALSLVLAESRREQERLLVFEDRDRIARDLHDLVIQRLFATGMMLQSAVRTTSDEDVSERVGRAVDELDETIREIRQTIFALHEPIEGPASGLRGRVLRETSHAAAILGFEPSVRFVGPVDAMVSTVTADHLVAALREALTNAAKHAQAERIWVVIELEGGDVLLRVTDDGIGVDPASGRRSGLANLSSRAMELGGTCQLERVRPEGGTRLRWRVPVADV